MKPEELKPEKLLELVIRFQMSGIFDPIVCEMDTSHRMLQGEIHNNKVVLVCPDCGFVKKSLPQLFDRPGRLADILAQGEKIFNRNVQGSFFRALSEV